MKERWFKTYVVTARWSTHPFFFFVKKFYSGFTYVIFSLDEPSHMRAMLWNVSLLYIEDRLYQQPWLVKPYDTAIIEISEENLQGEKNTITVIHYESLNNSWRKSRQHEWVIRKSQESAARRPRMQGRPLEDGGEGEVGNYLPTHVCLAAHFCCLLFLWEKYIPSKILV